MAQNLSQANAKALDALGSNKSEFTTELSVVESVCGAFITRVKENIQSIPNFVNSGKIENLTLESSGDEVHIKGSQHLLYQYRGVNGAKEKLYETPYSYGALKPPMQVFLTWIQEKNIRMVDNPKYYGEASPFKEVTEDKKQEQLAWMMVNTVFNKGMKPHPAINWDEEKQQLKKDLITKAKGFVIQKLKTEIYNEYGDRVDTKK